MAAYGSVIILYISSFVQDCRTRVNKNNVQFIMRVIVTCMALFGCLHCVSNLYGQAYLSVLFTEMLFSLLLIGMFITLLTLVDYWIYLSHILSGKFRSVHTITRESYIVIIPASVTAVTMLVLDVLIVYINEPICINIQMGIWAANCILTSVLIGVYGRKANTRISIDKCTVNKQIDTIYLKFRIIYRMYLVAPAFYSLIFLAHIPLSILFTDLTYWYIIYSLIHGVIIASAVVLFVLIFNKKLE